MSSLCLFPESDQPSGQNGAFPISAYDGLLTEIDRSLLPGRLLLIYNASYPFRLSTIGPQYNVVQADVVFENGFVNKLHRSGRAFTVTIARNHTRCHKMVSGIEEYRDSDFVDCLFRERDEAPDESPITLSAAPDLLRRPTTSNCCAIHPVCYLSGHFMQQTTFPSASSKRRAVTWNKGLGVRGTPVRS
jgi:hypothetical protein